MEYNPCSGAGSAVSQLGALFSLVHAIARSVRIRSCSVSPPCTDLAIYYCYSYIRHQ